MAWYVGQRVVCVDDNWAVPAKTNQTFPIKSEVYTIRDVVTHRGEVALRFVEILNPLVLCDDIYDKKTFYAWHFRPLTDTKKSTETGMDILREIVRNPKTPARSKQPAGVV